MIRDVVKFNDPRLRTPSKKVEDIHNPEIQALIQDMADTMDYTHGVGIAAPQVGQNLRIFWVNHGIHRFVIINSVLTILTKKTDLVEEGCLSYPGVFGKVKRPLQVHLRGHDQYGKKIDMIAEKYLARVIQHESDHLAGKVIVDKFTQ